MTICSGFSLDRKPDQFRCYRMILQLLEPTRDEVVMGWGVCLMECIWFGLYHLDI